MTSLPSPAHHDNMPHVSDPKARPSLTSGKTPAPAGFRTASAQSAPSPEQQAVIKRLSQTMGQHATACTAAFIARNHPDIIRESAAFMRSLEAVWAEEGLDPTDVWTELLRRIEVGDLFLRLNQPPHRKKLNGKAVRPWRISTSKLP
ncbi:phosphoribosyl-ATP pyrophosphatase [Acetobacter malorum]|uniref:Phosphoribosyl-ATP pyrophosphatase n=1 Tax=Acetobacter malorum TaxID=178901 RepID=A0A1Y3G6Y6_9PROT|nr:phosphoribosyl-ATP pyrophosphatase [Acetobacter malorum]OUJ06466.1 phosphoribosyl-ATP pyrophosphatase [Acetobacter malorum]